MTVMLAAQNVFGPATLVLISMMLSVGLLAVRTYVRESKIQVSRSSLVWLDAATILMVVLFFAFVYLRFRHLA